jgi:transcriptional regulator of NAD metabolism
MIAGQIRLSSIGLEIVQHGGFVKARELQIKDVSQSNLIDQAAIDAPKIARRSNVIAISSAVSTVLGIALSFWLHYHPITT